MSVRSCYWQRSQDCIIWSEESYKRFAETGFKAAIELYDAAVQNADFVMVQKDPNNPRALERLPRIARLQQTIVFKVT